MPLTTYDTHDFTELSDHILDPESVQLLPRAFCRRNCVVVLDKVDSMSNEPVLVGILQPDRLDVTDEIVKLLQRPIRLVRLNRWEIDRALQIGFDGAPTGWDTLDVRPITLGSRVVTADSPIPDLVDEILVDAVQAKASDIHLEVYFQDVDLRLRIDGMLHDRYTHLSPANVAEAVSRIKILAGMDISEKRRPQDGRFRVALVEGRQRRPVDFRVSVVPCPAGEDVVIRILDANQGLLSVDRLGMAPDIQELLHRLLANPEGMILVTGPTSSGKTTTLYAALSKITDANRKIITAEDPIEYFIDRVNQKQVTPSMSMMDLLRAALRQNPDVMLFGELRDLDSASTAVAAAETGHLVLGTLHTSDALGVISRLRGIGLENMDIGSTLLSAIGQRLVRRICPQCATDAPPTADEQRLYGPLLQTQAFRKGKGCENCRGSGYRGRLGIYELLLVDHVLQDAITAGQPILSLRRIARERGFRTLADDALAKAAAGVTTLEEVTRVIPYRQIALARTDAEEAKA